MSLFGKSLSVPASPHRALILDDDEIFLKMLSHYAEKAGLTENAAFADAEKLWPVIQKKAFDVIFLDWKLRGPTSGLALFNKIRRHPELAACPVIIVSGFVDKDDFRLLKEFPCTLLLEKPFTFKSFENSLHRVWEEYTWYAENSEQVKKILSEVGFKPAKAARKLEKMISSSPNPIPIGTIIGKYLVDLKATKEAERVFNRILKADPRNIAAMNEMAKIYHMQNRNDDALEMLRAANSLSPHNMERLCLTGQIELKNHQPEAAKAHFGEALSIDESDVTARAGMTLAENTEEFFAKANASISLPKNFASLMNTVGISKIRSGSLDDGIEQYNAALSFLNDDTEKAKVMFNLGLGFLRKRDIQTAFIWFSHSAEIGGEAFEKSQKYIRKLEPYVARLPPVENYDIEEEGGDAPLQVGIQDDPPSPMGDVTSIFGQAETAPQATAQPAGQTSAKKAGGPKKAPPAEDVDSFDDELDSLLDDLDEKFKAS